MGLFSKLREMKNIRKSNKLIEAAKDEYNAAQTRQEAIDAASKVAIKAIKAHPESEEGAIGVLKDLEKSEIPKDVRLNTVIQIPTTNQIKSSDEIVAQAVKELDFDSEDIRKILRETIENIRMKEARRIAAEIKDSDIRREEELRLDKIEKLRREKEKKSREEEKSRQENKKKEDLKKIYSKVDEKAISEFTNDVIKIKQDNRSDDIEQMVRRVLARRVATDYIKWGSTMISTLTNVISAEDMMQRHPTKLSKQEQYDNQEKDLNFMELVEIEYNNIKDNLQYKESDKRQYSFNKEQLEKLILREIAKNVVNTYNEVGIIDIPQSDTMKELSEEQEQFFINEIQTYGKDITNIEKIKNQIRGIQNREDEDWLNLIRKIPEDEKEIYFSMIQKKLQKGNKQKHHKEPLDSEIQTKLEEIEENLEGINIDDATEILGLTIKEIETIKKENQYDKSDDFLNIENIPENNEEER